MRLSPSLSFCLCLFAFTSIALAASPQDFSYERTIILPDLSEETSVWIPLDAHARQRPDEKYGIVDETGTLIPLKRVSEPTNILESAAIIAAPESADTIPKTSIDALTDRNLETYFQPITQGTHVFRFRTEREVAPEYLAFVLRSGWIDHIRVRIGSTPTDLHDAFVGTPSGTLLHLSGERGTEFEVTIETKSGVLQIAEAGLIEPSLKLLMRAESAHTYTLLYGAKEGAEMPSRGDEVFTDKNAITGTLGDIRSREGEGSDIDGDRIMDGVDSCPNVPNPDQRDRDGDGIGDVCDNAPLFPNGTQNDKDKDGIGDGQDNCPSDYNPDQKDIDLDSRGWVCDDTDQDGIMNGKDNCVGLPNRDQQDLNNDGIGDACADDLDRDGIPRTVDNCSTKLNPDQSDTDRDGIGDVCDVCPEHYDPKQIDRDENGIGDVCQNAIQESIRDTDADSFSDTQDLCPKVFDSEQKDDDGDQVGNACDNCPALKNTDQGDQNSDGKGDVCTDTDSDGILDPFDNCPTYENVDQEDQDENGIGNPCDDEDSDRIENARDNCPHDSNPVQADEDRDGQGNLCDLSDDRWSEHHPWIVWASLASIIVVLSLLGAVILKKTKSA